YLAIGLNLGKDRLEFSELAFCNYFFLNCFPKYFAAHHSLVDLERDRYTFVFTVTLNLAFECCTCVCGCGSFIMFMQMLSCSLEIIRPALFVTTLDWYIETGTAGLSVKLIVSPFIRALSLQAYDFVPDLIVCDEHDLPILKMLE